MHLHAHVAQRNRDCAGSRVRGSPASAFFLTGFAFAGHFACTGGTDHMTSLQFRNTWLGCCSVLMLVAASGCPKPSLGLGEHIDGGAAGGTAGSAGSAGPVAGTGGAAAGSGAGNSQACGSRGLRPCADDEFCSYPASASCGDTDAPASVRPARSLHVAIRAVCGCDGKTHGNACSAPLPVCRSATTASASRAAAASLGGGLIGNPALATNMQLPAGLRSAAQQTRPGSARTSHRFAAISSCPSAA